MQIGLVAALVFYMQHSVWVSSEVYSSSNLVLVANMPDGSEALYDDHREVRVPSSTGAEFGFALEGRQREKLRLVGLEPVDRN
jgi:hypothetical protein